MLLVHDKIRSEVVDYYFYHLQILKVPNTYLSTKENIENCIMYCLYNYLQLLSV